MQAAASFRSPIDRFKRIAKDNGLPPSPRRVGAVLALIRRAHCEAHQLESLLGVDAAFTAAFIAFANDARAPSQPPVSSLRAALAMVGSGTAVALLGESLTHGAFPYSDDPRFEAEWARTQTQTEIGSRIAASLGNLGADLAHTFLVLRDCAILCLLPCFTGTDATLDPREPHQEEDARAVSHPRAGALLASSWGLNDAIVTAIRDHHRLDAGEPPAHGGSMTDFSLGQPWLPHSQKPAPTLVHRLIALGQLVDQAQAHAQRGTSSRCWEQVLGYATRALDRPADQLQQLVERACK